MSRAFERCVRLIAFRPGLLLAVHGAIALFFAAQLVDFRSLEIRLPIATEIEKVLPAEGPDRDYYRHFRELFGNYEMVFVGIVDAEVFTAESLQRIRRLTKDLEHIDGVRRVLALDNAPGIRSEDGDVRADRLYDEIPEDEAELARLRNRILGDPLQVGNLVSEDGRATALLVYPEEMSEEAFRERGIDREIERVVRQEVGDRARVLIAGNPPLKAATGRILLRDLTLLVPLSFVFMGAIAFLSFRSLRGVAVPLLAIGMAQLWTTGTMVLLDRSLNLVTFIVPILINAVGFAYTVHMVSDHEDALRDGIGGGDAVSRALRHVAFPVFLTALTTAAGFLSLCLSRISAIREFGAFSVVGVIASMIAALTLAPAIQAYAKPRARRAGGDARQAGAGAIDRMAIGFARFDLRHRRALLAAGALVTALAFVGVSRIVVSTSFVGNLKADHPLRVSSHAFDEELGGSTTFHVMVEGSGQDVFKEPEHLAMLQELQRWLDAQPEVYKSTSLADYLMSVNRAFHDGDPERFRIPETRRVISQFLFFFWHDGLEDLVNSQYDRAHILVRAPAVSSQAINDFIDRAQLRLAELPEPFVGGITGDTVLIGRTMDEIAWGQAVSLTGAIVIIFSILLVYFRSPRIALLALIPNTLPVTVYFGTLGLTGVTLNIITSLIACVVLGIAVDDTLHFMVRFRESARAGADGADAVLAALRSVARPVTSTTAALCAGFLVLGASGLRHQVEFAVLSTAMLAFAWLVDMSFTPALCARMRIPAAKPPGPVAEG